MPTKRNPHHGSMQFWHRCRAKRQYPRIRTWAKVDAAKPLGFAGYKAGMTHCIIVDKRPNSLTKNEKIWIPVTILECPPMKAFAYVTYIMTPNGKKKHNQITAAKQDKDLARKMNLAKQPAEPVHPSLANICDVTLLVHTQPIKAGIGKKTPEVFEVAIGGKTAADKLTAAQGLLGKDILASDVFSEGQQVDCHVITRGKGLQGATKRFGTGLRHHKSEKGTRGPGNVGGWTGNRSWRVAHPGQTGYHMRTEINKWVVKIGNDVSEINPSSGLKHYGLVKGTYMLLKGSVGGPSKRLIRLAPARRPNHRIIKEAPKIDAVGTTA